MRRWTTILTILTAFTAGSLLSSTTVTSAVAQVVTGVFRGAGHGGSTIERFRFATAKGNRARVRIDREIVACPEDYGEMVTVTQDSGQTTLWFRDEDGVVRNIIVTKPDALLAVVPRRGDFEGTSTGVRRRSR